MTEQEFPEFVEHVPKMHKLPPGLLVLTPEGVERWTVNRGDGRYLHEKLDYGDSSVVVYP